MNKRLLIIAGALSLLPWCFWAVYLPSRERSVAENNPVPQLPAPQLDAPLVTSENGAAFSPLHHPYYRLPKLPIQPQLPRTRLPHHPRV